VTYGILPRSIFFDAQAIFKANKQECFNKAGGGRFVVPRFHAADDFTKQPSQYASLLDCIL
jgi:hypothetical protein